MTDMASDHAVVVREEEPGLFGVGMDPAFAIGQRALLVRTSQGNVLRECTPLLDDDAAWRITELGGISAICTSHPHFYAASVEFADAFGARILIRAQTSSGFSPSPRIESFDDEAEPVRGRRSPGSAATSMARQYCTAGRVAGSRRAAHRRHHHRGP